MSAELVRFDRKTVAMLCLLVLGVLGSTAFRIHGSSIGVWNVLSPERAPSADVLLGTPKMVRSDEYAVATLAMISQARAQPDFPRANPAWGAEQAPLIFSLPVRHWSMAVRPQLAGFLALDLERGFAFYWAMKTGLLLAGTFLLLLVLTRNDFGVSLFGAAWIYFSGYVQWWYSTPAMLPEMIGLVALGVVAAHYLALSPRRGVIALAALACALCALDAALSFYPPFQLPLAWFAIAIAAGSLAPRLRSPQVRAQGAFRAVCAAAATLLVVAVLALFYTDAKGAIDGMLGTSYPGRRSSTGGGVSLVRIFAGFFGPFMREWHAPRVWANVCEASGFVLLFPVPLGALLWRAWRRRKVAALEWSLCAYLVLTLSWLALGWPHWLATATGFGFSSGTRSLLGLGLASIVLSCVWLAGPRDERDLPVRPGARAALAGGFVALLALYSLAFQRETGGFASPWQIALLSLWGGAAGTALLWRRRAAFALLVLVPEIWGHGLVNPVARGLAPILEAPFAREISALVARQPDARFAVYGASALPDLFKSAGADVVNGTLVVPPLDALRVLDPRGVSSMVYNRFAHQVLIEGSRPGVWFELVQPDLYAIAIDPKSELWRALGVDYVALPHSSTDPAFLAVAEPVAMLRGVNLWLYAYRWRDDGR